MSFCFGTFRRVRKISSRSGRGEEPTVVSSGEEVAGKGRKPLDCVFSISAMYGGSRGFRRWGRKQTMQVALARRHADGDGGAGWETGGDWAVWSSCCCELQPSHKLGVLLAMKLQGVAALIGWRSIPIGGAHGGDRRSRLGPVPDGGGA